ncbi:hypothetical protein ZWY2020_055583 [Hordeum vulgare]|nr:hypothetical protein ZWY2020_055583 [Hordeum vulgare]
MSAYLPDEAMDDRPCRVPVRLLSTACFFPPDGASEDAPHEQASQPEMGPSRTRRLGRADPRDGPGIVRSAQASAISA